MWSLMVFPPKDEDGTVAMCQRDAVAGTARRPADQAAGCVPSGGGEAQGPPGASGQGGLSKSPRAHRNVWPKMTRQMKQETKSQRT